LQAKIDKINAQTQDDTNSGIGIAAVQKAKTAGKALASKVRAAPKL
jgi:hypothetical protein